MERKKYYYRKVKGSSKRIKCKMPKKSR